MLSDGELWACAAQLIQWRQENAGRFAASRIIALESAGDRDGALVWR